MTGSDDPLSGRVVDGRYRVDAELARGGMATVYRARDLRLDRPVALKVMHAHLARDDEFVRRFVHEARAAARLQHPHIVSVYDQGEDPDTGAVFLAMELVEGRTLRDVIRSEAPLSTRAALALLIPVTEALAAAHAEGMIHRDVKPENVLLARGRTNNVKVADFGLARVEGVPNITDGALWATVAYLAPEQVEHETSDARTDVYAVGLLLFELLTGQKAFPGQDPVRVAYEHVHGSVPHVRDTVPTVPEAVESLILRTSATDPSDRPRDASALLTALRALHRDLSPAELDAVPAPDHTMPVPHVDGDPTQVVRPGTSAGATRAIPVVRPGRAPTAPTPGRAPSGRTEGGFARTTGNRRTPPPRQTKPAKAPKERRKGSAAGWILGILLVLLLAGGGYGYWYLTEGPAVHSTLPSVVNLTEDEARRQLDAAQLDALVELDYSEDVPEGRVIGVDQPPGSVLRHGTDVTLLVSRGPERYAVPRLDGLTLEQAQQALEEANLVLGEQTSEHHESAAEGTVIRSTPPTGEQARPGTEVAVVLSDGPAPVDVADVTGRPEQEARDILTSAGLTVEVSPDRAYSDTVPEGSVVSQEPGPGQAERGTTVRLVLSQGPELVLVPQVVGRQYSVVEAELTELGLVVVREDVRGGFFGTVREQSVEPDTEVPRGTEIVLTVV